MHPLHGVNWRSSGPTDYCADLSVALHYYNAESKWKDDHNLLGLGYEKLLSGCRTMTPKPAGPGSVPPSTSCLARLAEYEAAGSEDLDAVSGCFGELMAELFDYKQDHWSPELLSGLPSGQVHLSDGRLRRSGPRQAEGRLQSPQNHERAARLRGRDAEIFELLLARCAKCFERLPCVEDADLLRNILYSGVWLKYNCNNAKRSGRDAEAST